MSATQQRGKRQIPIVCPGHTRPLAELQFTSITDVDPADAADAANAAPCRTFLISACHDKCPMLRDGTTGDWIGTWQGHKGAVWSCRLDPKAYLAATASGDFSAKVWDAITGKELMAFPHKHIVKTVDFSPDSQRLATGGHEGLLRVFDLANPQAQPLAVAQSPDRKVTITKLSWLDDATVLAAGADGNIRFWDVSGGGSSAPTLSQTLTVDAEVRDMELSRPTNGKIMLTVAHGTTVSFFDLTDGTSGKLLHAHRMPIHFREEGGATLHPDGTRFVAGGGDLWVRVFDFETGEELECHKGHHGPIRCLRYAPDGRTYATGSEDGTIRIWKTDP